VTPTRRASPPPPEHVAAITAAIATVQAERRAAAAAAADAPPPDVLNMWVEASRLSAQRAPLSRGPWRLSGRIGRRSRT
jgi:hypothetical protein